MSGIGSVARGVARWPGFVRPATGPPEMEVQTDGHTGILVPKGPASGPTGTQGYTLTLHS